MFKYIRKIWSVFYVIANVCFVVGVTIISLFLGEVNQGLTVAPSILNVLQSVCNFWIFYAVVVIVDLLFFRFKKTI